MFSTDLSLGNVLYWYQKKIGAYDQQSWEKSIEERVLKGFTNAVPKKVARIKTELIDLDLIRGSAFTKAKPQQGCLATIYLGIMRVILFPFYLKWWTYQTSGGICWLLLALYSLHISAIYIYFNRFTNNEFRDVPVSEVLSPIVMLFILGVMQSQIAASHLSKTEICCHNTRHHSSSRSFNNVQKSSKVRWQNRSELNSMEEEKNILKSNSKVEPLFATTKKKASDEESGLDPTDFPEARRSHNVSLKKRRRVLQEISLEMQNESDNSSVQSHNSVPNAVAQDAICATDTEPEHDVGDISSIEDCSPYSTVNSTAGTQWQQYADIVAKKLRFSKTHESSCHDSQMKRAKATLNAIKTSTRKNSGHRSNSQNSRRNENSRHTKTCYSSGDSEASFSPTARKGLTSDLDWPLINSDGSSDEDIEGDVEDETPAPNTAGTEFFTFSDEHRLSDDLPPSILNLVEENYQSVGTKSDKTCNDKGRRLLTVSCAIWQQNECQKVDLSVLDISSAVIRKVESKKYSNEYFYLGVLFSVILAIIPAVFRHQRSVENRTPQPAASESPPFEFPKMPNATTTLESVDLIKYLTVEGNIIADFSFQFNLAHLYVVSSSLCVRFFLSLLFFFLLCVAERTFKERFLYAKYFCHLTSSRRARGSELPHFRLNKVRNIKTWLSVRSYLKKHGPQRSVNVIVSTSFIVAVSILTFLCIQLLRESEICAGKLYCWEMVFWNLSIGIYIMRLIILGSKMNKKYRSNLSVLITEQINLYLQMEQKPHKKDVLSLANNVLKLAASLLKQLEVPFKISGFSANPYLYNITKVIVLSAFSAVMTEMLGFKLKLYKIKLPG